MFDYDELDDLDDDTPPKPKVPSEKSPKRASEPILGAACKDSTNVRKEKPIAKRQTKPKPNARDKSSLEDKLAALALAEQQQHDDFLQMMEAQQPPRRTEELRTIVTQSNLMTQRCDAKQFASGSSLSALHNLPLSQQPIAASWRLPPLEFLVMEKTSVMHIFDNELTMAELESGNLVSAVEETFDGWIRIIKPCDGWMKRDSTIDALGAPELVAVAARASKPGPQEFEVTAATGVEVFSEPAVSSIIRSTRQLGEVVLAETQTYHGWIRLMGNTGWMQSRSKKTGQLLKCLCTHEQEHNSAYYEQEVDKADRETAAENALLKEIERAKASNVWEKLAHDESASIVTGTSSSRESAQRSKNVFGFAPEGEVFALYNKLERWNFKNLPTQEFRVVHTDVLVRTEPKFSGAVCGKLSRGSVVLAIEETFDGWIKLADQPGWAPRDMCGRDSYREVLERMGLPDLLAVPEFIAGGPSRRMFEVVFEPRVTIMMHPKDDSEIKGSRRFGEFVLAESQTYHGWVRLADDLGWMLTTSKKHGQLLCSVSTFEHAAPMMALSDPSEQEPTEDEKRKKEMEREILNQVEALERDEALAELEKVATSGDACAFRNAMRAAKKVGVAKVDIARMNVTFSLSST